MRKLFIILILSFCFNVNAEVTTYERTKEDLRINDSITVTESNIDNIMNTPSVDESIKVYDFANLLSDSEEQTLYYDVTEFIANYNMDLALVTIDDNYSTAQVYADDFYDYNNFGLGSTYDGLLVLIDMDTREFYISTTGKAILMYNDNRINSVLDNMTYYMQNGNYFKALEISVSSLSNFAESGIPSGNSNSYIDSNGDYVYVENVEYPFFPILIISIIIATIVLMIFINKNKLVKKAYEASFYLEEENANIKNLGDIFLTTHTSRVRINTDSGSSSSFSSGGGSSTHSSSSGRSHGGGGRSF